MLILYLSFPSKETETTPQLIDGVRIQARGKCRKALNRQLVHLLLLPPAPHCPWARTSGGLAMRVHFP